MTERFSEPQLSQLSEFIEQKMGLHFPKERWSDLARAIAKSANELGLAREAPCIEELMALPVNKHQVEILASHLTVGETYFFREKKTFEVLEDHILPELTRARQGTERHLRIWSAGCCTGEEPYSIAISLSRIIPDWRNWNITILATDINPMFLKKAEEGKYGQWSFRDVHPVIKDTYFSRTDDGRFVIHGTLKQMVQFSYLNLAEDAYPSLLTNTNAMDIIFCRNVLMYFTQKRAMDVIEKLRRSLVDGGWLIVSATEASHALFSRFSTVNIPGTIVYRKMLGAGEEFNLKKSFPSIDEVQSEDQPLFQRQFFEEKSEAVVTSDVVQATEEGVMDSRKVDKEAPNYKEALALFDRGLYAQAQADIERLLSIHENDTKLMALLARVFANQGKLSDAEIWAQKANTIDKLNPVHRYLLATILQEQGKFDKAMASLKQALYLDQRFIVGHFALGNIARIMGKPAEASKYFHNAMDLLHECQNDEILSESDGITAGRLAQVIQSTIDGQQFDGKQTTIT